MAITNLPLESYDDFLKRGGAKAEALRRARSKRDDAQAQLNAATAALAQANNALTAAQAAADAEAEQIRQQLNTAAGE